MFERGPAREPHEVTCPQCHGTGKMKDSKGNPTKCDRCNERNCAIAILMANQNWAEVPPNWREAIR